MDSPPYKRMSIDEKNMSTQYNQRSLAKICQDTTEHMIPVAQLRYPQKCESERN